MAIERPQVHYDDASHTYTFADGEAVLGVSTVAKIGGAEDSFSIASAWGWRLGYEGAFELLNPANPIVTPNGTEELRSELKRRGLTPWSNRDRAAERGNWVHDVLESLAQDGTVPDLEEFPAGVRGHVLSVIRWFLAFRPSFVATEVQVSSERYRFAGRYDLRALIDARRLLPCIDPYRTDAQAERIRQLAAEGKEALGLLDLKTSKRVYPTTHFPQLEGYEGAGVEMGFPATDFRAVVNTWETGEFDPAQDFAVSWSSYDDFLAYLEAVRAIRRIKDGDPTVVKQRKQEDTILSCLPSTSRGIVGRDLEILRGLDARDIGRVLGKLRKKGYVEQDGLMWQIPQTGQKVS